MLRWVTLWRPVCIGFNLSFERLSVSWYERTWNAMAIKTSGPIV